MLKDEEVQLKFSLEEKSMSALERMLHGTEGVKSGEV